MLDDIKASQDHTGGPVKFVSLAPLPQPGKPVYSAAQEGAKSFLAYGKALVAKHPNVWQRPPNAPSPFIGYLVIWKYIILYTNSN